MESNLRIEERRPAVALPAATAAPGPARRAALVLSVLVAGLMAVTAAAGLWIRDLYPEVPWAGAAFRGGDLVTFAVAAPVLAAALVLAARGSQRALLIWAAMLTYALYNYTYVVFGATFNDLFAAHIVLLASTIWALICLLSSLDVAGIAARFGERTPARWVAGLCGVVAATLGGMWGYAIVRQAITGELPAGAPSPAQLHMVYATDLTVFVSALGVAAVLLWRRTRWGYLLGVIMSVASATYLVNLMSAAVFQARAQVEGVAAFSPLALGLDLAFVAASAAMLLTMRPRRVRLRD